MAFNIGNKVIIDGVFEKVGRIIGLKISNMKRHNTKSDPKKVLYKITYQEVANGESFYCEPERIELYSTVLRKNKIKNFLER